MKGALSFNQRMEVVLEEGFTPKEKWVVRTWYDLEDEDEDISTERLLAMTSQMTNTSYDKIPSIMDKFSSACIDFANIEKPAKLEGRSMLMFLAPKPTK